MKKLLFIVCLSLFSFSLQAASFIKKNSGTFRFLNKVTGKYEEKILPLNQLYIFDDNLKIILRTCYRSSAQDEPENIGFVQIVKDIKQSAPKTTLSIPKDFGISEIDTQHNYSLIFSGWLFSSSPSLNLLEDAIYDVSLVMCK